ncbi:Thioesterase superfamily [Macleaya cordata]|uniref:Thioesterase superfamily n=1 Tax=Macleaya cordata TaxID=56857 RepID=A0A200QUG2_MACCD|nr:Thioesterase superfamily [Macleaya cordata]
MAKPLIDHPQLAPSSSSSSSVISSSNINIDNNLSWILNTYFFFQRNGVFSKLPESSIKKGFYFDMIRDFLQVDRIERGRVTCLLTVKPPVFNSYKTLHGGAVAAVAELVAMACAKTIVDADNDLFLGELSISYLSSATVNVVLEVDGSIVRSGRNVTVASVEFRNKETRKVVYTARATFYTMPLANL